VSHGRSIPHLACDLERALLRLGSARPRLPARVDPEGRARRGLEPDRPLHRPDELLPGSRPREPLRRAASPQPPLVAALRVRPLRGRDRDLRARLPHALRPGRDGLRRAPSTLPDLRAGPLPAALLAPVPTLLDPHLLHGGHPAPPAGRARGARPRDRLPHELPVRTQHPGGGGRRPPGRLLRDPDARHERHELRRGGSATWRSPRSQHSPSGARHPSTRPRRTRGPHPGYRASSHR
jgi:hypothetical protein